MFRYRIHDLLSGEIVYFDGRGAKRKANNYYETLLYKSLTGKHMAPHITSLGDIVQLPDDFVSWRQACKGASFGELSL